MNADTSSPTATPNVDVSQTKSSSAADLESGAACKTGQCGIKKGGKWQMPRISLRHEWHTHHYIRLLAGCMVLLGTALAYWVTEWGFLVLLFIGFNLIQSAITNLCPPEVVMGRLGVRTQSSAMILKLVEKGMVDEEVVRDDEEISKMV